MISNFPYANNLGLYKPFNFQLKRDHPLARGLVFDVEFQDQTIFPQELVNHAFGSPTGTPVPTPSPMGPGMQFNAGSNNYIDFAEDNWNIMTGSELTLESWVVPFDTAGGQFFSKPHVTGAHTSPFFSYALQSTNLGGRVWVTTSGNPGGISTSEVFFPANQILHAVGIYDGANVKYYANGELKATAGATGTLTNFSGVPLRITSNGGGSEVFNGIIINCRMWNRALNDEEVRYLYNAPWGLLSKRNELDMFGKFTGSLSSGPYGILSSANIQSKIKINKITYGSQNAVIDHTVSSQDEILLILSTHSGAPAPAFYFNNTPLTLLRNNVVSAPANALRCEIFYLSTPNVGTYSITFTGNTGVFVVMSIEGVNKEKITPVTFSSNGTGNNAIIAVDTPIPNSMILDVLDWEGPDNGFGTFQVTPNQNQQTILNFPNSTATAFAASFAIVGPGQNNFSWKINATGGTWLELAVVLEPAYSSSLWRPDINLRYSFDANNNNGFSNAAISSLPPRSTFSIPNVFWENSFLHTVGRINVIPIVTIPITPGETEQPTSQIIIDKVYQGQIGGGSTLPIDVNIPSTDAALVVTGGSAIATGGAWQDVSLDGTKLTQLAIATQTNSDAEIWWLPNPPVGNHTLSITPTAVTGQVYANAMVVLGVDKRTTPQSISVTDAAATSTITAELFPDAPNSLIVDALATIDATAMPIPNLSQTQVYNGSSINASEYVMSSYRLSANGDEQMNYNLSATVNAAMVAVAFKPARPASMWFPNINFRTLNDTVTTNDLDVGQGLSFGQYGYKSSNFHQNSFLHTIGRMFSGARGAISASTLLMMGIG